jgi:hypothetical protein
VPLPQKLKIQILIVMLSHFYNTICWSPNPSSSMWLLLKIEPLNDVFILALTLGGLGLCKERRFWQIRQTEGWSYENTLRRLPSTSQLQEKSSCWHLNLWFLSSTIVKSFQIHDFLSHLELGKGTGIWNWKQITGSDLPVQAMCPPAAQQCSSLECPHLTWSTWIAELSGSFMLWFHQRK